MPWYFPSCGVWGFCFWLKRGKRWLLQMEHLLSKIYLLSSSREGENKRMFSPCHPHDKACLGWNNNRLHNFEGVCPTVKAWGFLLLVCSGFLEKSRYCHCGKELAFLLFPPLPPPPFCSLFSFLAQAATPASVDVRVKPETQCLALYFFVCFARQGGKSSSKLLRKQAHISRELCRCEWGWQCFERALRTGA